MTMDDDVDDDDKDKDEGHSSIPTVMIECVECDIRIPNNVSCHPKKYAMESLDKFSMP